jgi:hypothetical protein
MPWCRPVGLFGGSLRLNFDNLEGRMGAMDNLHHRAQANRSAEWC